MVSSSYHRSPGGIVRLMAKTLRSGSLRLIHRLRRCGRGAFVSEFGFGASVPVGFIGVPVLEDRSLKDINFIPLLTCSGSAGILQMGRKLPAVMEAHRVASSHKRKSAPAFSMRPGSSIIQVAARQRMKSGNLARAGGRCSLGLPPAQPPRRRLHSRRDQEASSASPSTQACATSRFGASEPGTVAHPALITASRRL